MYNGNLYCTTTTPHFYKSIRIRKESFTDVIHEKTQKSMKKLFKNICENAGLQINKVTCISRQS